MPTEHISGASTSSTRQLHYVQVPEPPSIPAPPVPNEAPQPDAQPPPATHFSTLRSEVRAGAIRVDINNPEQWSPGETAILRSQEAKQARDIESLIFETPIQHDYEVGVEVRSLLPTERLEEMEGRLAVTDEDSSGNRYVKFWVDENSTSPTEKLTSPIGDENTSSRAPPTHSLFPTVSKPEHKKRRTSTTITGKKGETTQDRFGQDRGFGSGSPDFGGAGYFDEETCERGRIPGSERSHSTNPTNSTRR